MPTELIKCNGAVRTRRQAARLWTCTLIGMLIEMFTRSAAPVLSRQGDGKSPGVPRSCVKGIPAWQDRDRGWIAALWDWARTLRDWTRTLWDWARTLWDWALTLLQSNRHPGKDSALL